MRDHDIFVFVACRIVIKTIVRDVCENVKAWRRGGGKCISQNHNGVALLHHRPSSHSKRPVVAYTHLP